MNTYIKWSIINIYFLRVYVIMSEKYIKAKYYNANKYTVLPTKAPNNKQVTYFICLNRDN